MKRAYLLGIALAVPLVAAPAALADDDNDRGRYAISDMAAADIAASVGVATVEELERDDGYWEVEGHTFDGCEIEVDIHGWSGEILKREIDDCPGSDHDDDDDWGDD